MSIALVSSFAWSNVMRNTLANAFLEVMVNSLETAK